MCRLPLIDIFRIIVRCPTVLRQIRPFPRYILTVGCTVRRQISDIIYVVFLCNRLEPCFSKVPLYAHDRAILLKLIRSSEKAGQPVQLIRFPVKSEKVQPLIIDHKTAKTTIFPMEIEIETVLRSIRLTKYRLAAMKSTRFKPTVIDSVTKVQTKQCLRIRICKAQQSCILRVCLHRTHRCLHRLFPVCGSIIFLPCHGFPDCFGIRTFPAVLCLPAAAHACANQ